jgi:NAD(P)-dependent dehydrogenase (short-subunit alcohol dehydrogenase family)
VLHSSLKPTTVSAACRESRPAWPPSTGLSSSATGSTTPQHRAAAPEEIGPLVVFLASAAASFITGSVIVADGGYTLW